MGFWERTWQERSDVLTATFGETEPPGMVTSFSWQDRIRCPGACAITFPPVERRRDPIRHARNDWLNVSQGLSQPADKKVVEFAHSQSNPWSGLGYEMGILTPKVSRWPVSALYRWLTLVTDGEETGAGHRFPFGFYMREGVGLDTYIGEASDLDIDAKGDIRAAMHWPFLFPDATFRTSTGRFILLIAVGITKDEWEFAKQTSSTHLQLLLCKSGVGQRTLPDRSSLMANTRLTAEQRRIGSLSEEECAAELHEGIGQWHLMEPPCD